MHGSVFAARLGYRELNAISAPPLLAAPLVLDGLDLGLLCVVKMSRRQRLVSPELLGRVGGAYGFVVTGAAPIGAFSARR